MEALVKKSKDEASGEEKVPPSCVFGTDLSCFSFFFLIISSITE